MKSSATHRSEGLWPVVVAGAGPAGSATAIALAQAGHDVLLVERSRFEEFRAGEALAPFARALLAKLGVEESVMRGIARPSLAICSAWGAESLARQSFMSDPYGHGWHVDRRRFDEMLAETAARAGATLSLGARVTGVERGDGGVRVVIATGDGEGEREVVLARVVVDATGRNARVAHALGASRVVYDRLIAVVAVLPAREGGAADAADARSGDVLMIEALEDGWFYSVRLPDGALLVAWMTDGDLWERDEGAPLARWSAAVAASRHTRERARPYGAPGAVHLRSAATSRLDEAVGEGWMAVGDAASAYDPASAKGVCMAIASGLSAAGAIAARLAGDEAPARAYAADGREAFDGYLGERAQMYGLERRWPSAVFWRRRWGRRPPL